MNGEEGAIILREQGELIRGKGVWAGERLRIPVAC